MHTVRKQQKKKRLRCAIGFGWSCYERLRSSARVRGVPLDWYEKHVEDERPGGNLGLEAAAERGSHLILEAGRPGRERRSLRRGGPRSRGEA